MSRVFHLVERIDNPSDNPSLDAVLRSRRAFLARAGAAAAGVAGRSAAPALTAASAGSAGRAAAGLAALAGLAGCSGVAGVTAPTGPGRLGFHGIAASSDDTVRVPDGYRAGVLLRWGDPIGDPRGAPAFRFDASNTADEQALQAGTHHDGMKYFPLPFANAAGPAARHDARTSSGHGLLAINHEYPDDGTLFPDGRADWSIGKVRKAQHALGVSVVEVVRDGDRWRVVSPSRYARRVHGNTPMRVGGPAAGHALMRTVESPGGLESFGTFANCANGWTPWGTYLTCEENFNFYFRGRERPTADEARYGISARNDFTRWGAVDPRFDVARNPNEPNHFGWVVEIDPYDPSHVPVKRTALGRKKQEGAAPAICRDGRVAFYMGDDQAFEYLYKFVTARPWNPAERAANRDLLDDGTLYVARFDASGEGEWVALVFGRNGLAPENGFASQAEVLVRARQAADRAGGTRLDRPEWTAVDPATGTVFVSLTNNADRGKQGRPGADAANPRAPNRFGHILRWTQAGGDHGATRFHWDILALAGDPNAADAGVRGNVVGDAYASPDGLMVDARGVLWVQTDVSPTQLLQGDHARYGNNQMLAVDPDTRETRRFLTGPRGAEITGACLTPDGTTMFVNVQHPGEAGNGGVDPKAPRAVSNWPDHRPDGRPRSATVAIRRDDGGVIGA